MDKSQWEVQEVTLRRTGDSLPFDKLFFQTGASESNEMKQDPQEEAFDDRASVLTLVDELNDINDSNGDSQTPAIEGNGKIPVTSEGFAPASISVSLRFNHHFL